MRWWGVEIECPTCKVPTTLQMANFSADGEIMFVALCPKCNQLVKWRVYGSALAYMAMINDQKAKPKERGNVPINHPVQPPLALPSPCPNCDFTSEDRLLLGEFHIKDEEGQEGTGVQ